RLCPSDSDQYSIFETAPCGTSFLQVWNSPSGPTGSKVELVPTRSWLNAVPCGSGTRTPSTWKLKRQVSGGTGTAVVAVHSPVASFVMTRPRVVPRSEERRGGQRW